MAFRFTEAELAALESEAEQRRQERRAKEQKEAEEANEEGDCIWFDTHF